MFVPSASLMGGTGPTKNPTHTASSPERVDFLVFVRALDEGRRYVPPEKKDGSCPLLSSISPTGVP